MRLLSQTQGPFFAMSFFFLFFPIFFYYFGVTQDVLLLNDITQGHVPRVARFVFHHLVLFQWRLCAR